MRWLGRFLLCLLLLCLAYITWSYLRALWSEFDSTTEVSLDNARASIFFVLNEEKGLVYPIAPADRLLRFYIHAGFESRSLPEKLDVILHYEWLDDAGKVIQNGQYALVVRPRPLLRYNPLDLAQALPSRFYVDDGVTPSLDESLYFSPLDAPGAVALRLRMGQRVPGLSFLGVRSYIRSYRNTDQVDMVWRRMSQGRKEQLSDASIYPHYLLSSFERNNLLSAYWTPIGPKGAPPKDYLQSTLYIREGGIDIPDEEQFKPSGHYASDTQAVTFNIDQPGRYKVVAKSLGAAPSSQALVVWQGLQRSEHWEQPVVLEQGDDSENRVWEADLNPGLLQWQPLSAMTVELFQWVSDSWVSRTPERQFAKAFVCGPNQPLEYTLSPGERLQPLQLVLRSFHRSDVPGFQENTTRMRYRIDNNKANTLLQGVLQNQPVLDLYRQFADAAWIDSRIYEAEKVFINASHQAARLHIECEQFGLISVYSRPSDLPIKKHYPLDRRPWMQHEDKLPAWFGMLPVPRERTAERPNDYALVWYRQPVVAKPEMAAGNFAWTWLDTAGQHTWLEKQLFSSRDSADDIRHESLSAVYTELDNSEDGKVVLYSPLDQQLIRPKLLYLSQDVQDRKIAVSIDGQPTLETMLNKRFGSLSLPPMKPGQHSFAVMPALKAKWFINHSKPLEEKDESYVLRSAYRVEKNSVQLRLPLLDIDQSVSLWFYVPDSFQQQQTLVCDARLKAEQADVVENARTLALHQFNFHDLDSNTAYALQGRELQYIGPLKSSIVLKNIPQQTAVLELSCNAKEWLVSAGLIAEGAREYDIYSEIMAQYE